MTEQPDTLAEIAKRIEDIAQARLDSGRTCYLSHVGIELGQDLLQLRALTGLTLAEFIKTRMSDRFVMISVGPNKNVLALWPAGEEYSPDQVVSNSPSSRQRFDRELWLAFSLPGRGRRRFFDPVERKLHDADEPGSERWIEVPGQLLRTEGGEYDASRIEENLRAWLSEHHLDETDFRVSMIRSPSIVSRRGNLNLATNALEVILSTLDKRQLQTTSLALDVVEALLRNRL